MKMKELAGPSTINWRCVGTGVRIMAERDEVRSVWSDSRIGSGSAARITWTCAGVKISNWLVVQDTVISNINRRSVAGVTKKH